MHSGNFNRYFSVYSNRCTQRTEDDRTVRKVLYAYDRDSSLIRVELPLAMPTIIGGLRMSTVYTVSWAVLASMIGGGGLGDFIYSGISSNDNGLILMGAIPAALLAFVLGSLVDLVQRQVVPKGMRKGGDKV